jgi:hypothetical protein
METEKGMQWAFLPSPLLRSHEMIRQKGWHRGRRVLFIHASEARMNRSENHVNRRQNTIRQFDSIAAWRCRYRFFQVSPDCRRGDGCKCADCLFSATSCCRKATRCLRPRMGRVFRRRVTHSTANACLPGHFGARFKAVGQVKRFSARVKQDSRSGGN